MSDFNQMSMLSASVGGHMLFNYGKYKGVIISVALFLLLDASVLMINFYTSFQITKDAIAVNLAGRQRMLSQRAMKSLLDMELSKNDTAKFERASSELSNVANLFNSTLLTFDQGGEVLGTAGKNETLEIVSTPKARAAVDDTKVLWKPFYEKIGVLLSLGVRDPGFQQVLRDATLYGNENNLTILSQMNDLTVEMESVATSKATRLRIIQTVGILLAVINFFIIMVHFIRQLRESDEKVEAAQQQTKDILTTVDQGLFLLDQDLKISDEYSNEMYRIFGGKRIAKSRFIDFIKGMVSSTDLSNVERYFKLMFDSSKKQRLLGDLNPLKQVAIQVPDGNNGYINKHLKFAFSRVDSNDDVDKVLTTVTDITEQVKLSAELEVVKGRNEQQLEMISVLLNSDPDMIAMFTQGCTEAYRQINRLLEDASSSGRQYHQKASNILAIMHTVKGEAGALNLEVIANQCHEFEVKLKSIQAQTDITGNDFLPLTVILDRLMSYDTLLRELQEKIYANKTSKQLSMSTSSNTWQHLKVFANEIAGRQGKKVEVTMAGLNEAQLNSRFAKQLNSILVQLVRNAVTHGIEQSEQRALNKKPTTGLINISFIVRDNGDFRLTFSDDGQGINRQKLLQTAIDRKRISEAQAKQMSLNNIIILMFEANISQQTTADIDSGQGIGLYSVKKTVEEIEGKISIKEIPTRGISFSIDIPAKANLSLPAIQEKEIDYA
ncbi:MAG: type IV pili methyl-accepting chemotaxis transducer N-terminal domain-containing protein [Acidiferrobacterales bacterium]|nr:type IV pili methyl-accepting chemotaxis transducer N-terminal domain-containing protein [Acidiferrobacterales bacterium]